jgi:hypothetical protein
VTVDAAVELDEDLDERQRAALDACVIAAVTLCAVEGEAGDRISLVMQCHGRLVRAWGPGQNAPTFAEFTELLGSGPVGRLLPGPARSSQVWGLRLVAADGSAAPGLAGLALDAGEQALSAPGIGVEAAHLYSVLRAVGKIPAGAGLARITAEAVQHAVFRAMLAAGFDAYTLGREALVRSPVMGRRDVARMAQLAGLGVYTEIATMRQFAGLWARCPVCRWTMRATPRGPAKAEFACEDVRHQQRGCRFLAVRTGTGWTMRPLGERRDVPQLLPVDGWVALSYGLWQWITIPGLLEVELKDLAEACGAAVRLWPFGDTYDLHITKGTRIWKVDVKTWADPQGIAARLREEGEDCRGLCIVIPEHLRGYVGVLARALAPLGARALTDQDLIDEVRAA